MIFYKAIPVKSLVPGKFIPGTVTSSYDEAYMWWERYNSKKKNIKGAAKHIERQPACIVSFDYDVNLLHSMSEFQRSGVCEHDRKSCWTSLSKDKAQINELVGVFTVVLKEPYHA